MAVKVGVVGAGIWGRMHCGVYSRYEKAELVAVCDLDESRARSAAEEFGAESFYANVEDMLDQCELDAVAVATPDFAHREIAETAARAGKHLIVEKPLATNVKDAEAMVNTAADNGVQLMVDFHNRWNPMFVAVRKAIDDDELGTPAHIYIRHSNTLFVPREMLSWSNRSSVAWFLGSHSADLARWLARSEVKRVYCVSRKRILPSKGIDAPDFFLSTLEFDNGTVAVLENSWLLPDSLPTLGDFKAEIVGSKGVAYVDYTRPRAVEVFGEKKARLPDLFAAPTIYGKETGFARESIRHFVDCLAQGETTMVTGSDGLANTRIICGLLESAEKGEPVEL